MVVAELLCRDITHSLTSFSNVIAGRSSLLQDCRPEPGPSAPADSVRAGFARMPGSGALLLQHGTDRIKLALRHDGVFTGLSLYRLRARYRPSLLTYQSASGLTG
ncbi:TPA: hypothetical protein ACN02O_002800, partial [Klebsiella oxytoca]